MAVRIDEREGRLSIWHGDFLLVDSGDQVRLESKDKGSLIIPKQAWSELVGAWHQAQRKRARDGR